MPIGLLCIGMEERNGLQREGWNERSICLAAFGMHQMAQEAASESCNEELALFTT